MKIKNKSNNNDTDKGGKRSHSDSDEDDPQKKRAHQTDEQNTSNFVQRDFKTQEYNEAYIVVTNQSRTISLEKSAINRLQTTTYSSDVTCKGILETTEHSR